MNERQAVVRQFGRAEVARLRKDFLALMKNENKVKDYRQAMEWSKAFRRWSKGLEKFIFKDLIRAVKDMDGVPGWIKDFVDNDIRKDLWALVIDAPPIYSASKEVSAEQEFVRYKERQKRWSGHIRRAARQAWKRLYEFIEWYENAKGEEPQIDVVETEKVTMEGFTVFIVGDRSDWNVPKRIELLKASLKRYKAGASKRAPILLKYRLPIEYDFGCGLDEGGHYDGRRITLCPFAVINPARGAKIAAHEMAHHVWRRALGTEQKEVWGAMITGNLGELDIGQLLRDYPNENVFWDNDKIKAADPVLYLQVNSLIEHPGTSLARTILTREDLEKHVAKYGPMERVSRKPISAYASKNEEEAFCEAIGQLVGYGPSAVPEEARYTLRLILPRGVKVTASSGNMDGRRIAQELLGVARELLAAKGDKCGEKGCIRKVGDGWKIMSGKTGKFWKPTYDTKEEAMDVLKRYHGWGF